MKKDTIYNWTIYKITSPSDRVYIGKSSDFNKRLYSYRNGHCVKQRLLYNSLKKYGFENHTIECIDSFSGSNDYANDKEMFWIRSFMSNNHKWDKRGMNLTDGGDGTIGLRMSIEAKNKMSLKKIGKEPPNKGKPMPIHQVEMQRERMKGKSPLQGKTFSHLPEEERKRWFGSHNLGNSYNKGRKLKPHVVEMHRKRLTGKPNVFLYKAILQYSNEGEFIKEYDSIKNASAETGLSCWTIGCIAKGNMKRPHKYVFKYKKA